MKKLLGVLSRAGWFSLYILVTIVTRIIYVLSITIVYIWFVLMTLFVGHESSFRWMMATLTKMK